MSNQIGLIWGIEKVAKLLVKQNQLSNAEFFVLHCLLESWDENNQQPRPVAASFMYEVHGINKVTYLKALPKLIEFQLGNIVIGDAHNSTMVDFSGISTIPRTILLTIPQTIPPTIPRTIPTNKPNTLNLKPNTCNEVEVAEATTPKQPELFSDSSKEPKLDKPKREKVVFVKPTLEEIEIYIISLGKTVEYAKDEASNFYDHYEVVNWIPKNYTKQMSDWQACLRRWIKRSNKYSNNTDSQQILFVTPDFNEVVNFGIAQFSKEGITGEQAELSSKKFYFKMQNNKWVDSNGKRLEDWRNEMMIHIYNDKMYKPKPKTDGVRSAQSRPLGLD